MAIYYALGCHTKKDWDLAKQYLHKSAEQDFSRAQADLGIMLVKDHMYVEGLQWLERAEQAVNIHLVGCVGGIKLTYSVYIARSKSIVSTRPYV